MRCVMRRHARTPKVQLSGPTVHPYTVSVLLTIIKNLLVPDKFIFDKIDNTGKEYFLRFFFFNSM